MLKSGELQLLANSLLLYRLQTLRQAEQKEKADTEREGTLQNSEQGSIANTSPDILQEVRGLFSYDSELICIKINLLFSPD